MPRNPFEDPVEIAQREARARGVCPILLLDDFFTDHWDHDTLCSGFECASCVGNPLDEYFDGDDGPMAWTCGAEPEELEVPF